LWAVATTWVRETLILHNPETKSPTRVKVLLKAYLNKEHNLFDLGEEEPKNKKKKTFCLAVAAIITNRFDFIQVLNKFSYLNSRKQNGVCCNMFLQAHNTN